MPTEGTARLLLGGHHGTFYGYGALSGGQTDSDGVHSQCELTRNYPTKRLLEPAQEDFSEGLTQVAVLSGHQDTAYHVFGHHGHGSEWIQKEIWPSLGGGQCTRTSLVRQGQRHRSALPCLVGFLVTRAVG